MRSEATSVINRAAEAGAEGHDDLEALTGNDPRAVNLGVVEHPDLVPESQLESGLRVEPGPLGHELGDDLAPRAGPGDVMGSCDDDAVPDIDSKTPKQVLQEAKALKKRLDNEGIAAEMVAPRLWFAPQTIDGGYTSNDPKQRRYAIDRSRQSIDIANELGTDILVLWLAREGTYLRESKSGARSTELLVEAFDAMLKGLLRKPA